MCHVTCVQTQYGGSLVLCMGYLFLRDVKALRDINRKRCSLSFHQTDALSICTVMGEFSMALVTLFRSGVRLPGGVDFSLELTILGSYALQSFFQNMYVKNMLDMIYLIGSREN